MIKAFKKFWLRITIRDKEMLNKQLATVDNEPWIRVIDVVMTDADTPATGYFELDWNQAFVDQLVTAGYSGRTDNELIDQWFNDLCRGVISDNI